MTAYLQQQESDWRRDAALTMASCLAVAAAGWLMPASVHIVQWPESGPVRLALLAPAWHLPVWLAVGALAAALAIWRKASRWISFTPLLLLWLWAIPYLPWLPDRLPLLLALAGPGRWILAAVAIALALRPAVPTPEVRGALGLLDRRAVLALSAAIYVGFGAYSAASLSTGGDEPHYLIITESLIRDGDLKIENNHQQRHYLPFFGGNLRPDFFVRGQDGEIYSIHAPGLPVVSLPAYLVGGRMGVVIFIALIAALTAVAVFDLAAAVAGNGIALATWAACCLTVPFIPYAWLIFPEMPGACVVAWAAVWSFDARERNPRTWLLRGVLLASLPWLHTKFIVFLAIFGAGMAWRLRTEWRRLVWFALPVGVSVLGWFYSFYRIYGTFNPEAPYGAYSATFVLTRNIPHGLLGIFFDQKFGLLPYSPIYLFAVPGLWLLWRRQETRFLALVLGAAVAAFVGSTARLYMFWGGTSAPARFLVPIVPCLAPMVALGIAAVRSAPARGLANASIAVGMAFGILGMGWPTRFFLFSVDHGRARILELLQGGAPLAMSVPTFTEPDWPTQLPLFAAWTAVALLAFWAASALGKPRQDAWRAVGAFCAVFAIGGAAVSAAPSLPARADAARRGALETLWRFDGSRFRTLDYTTLSRVSDDRLKQLTAVDLTRPAPDERSGLAADVVPLPAGAYEAEVSYAADGELPESLTIHDPPAARYAAIDRGVERSTRVPFVLPMAARRLTISASPPEAARGVTRVILRPQSIVPPDAREPVPVRTIESIPDRPLAYLGYTDDHVYPERGAFWSRGLARPLVFLAPGGYRRLVLTLSTGPMPSRVTLTVGGEQRIVTMPGGRDMQEEFVLPPDARIIPLTVQSTTMFRPSEIDPESTDGRGLGCQVRVALE